MNILYPVTDKGLWHDGMHIEGTEQIKLKFPGEIAAYRKKNELIVPDKTPDLVQPEDVLLFTTSLAAKMTPGLFGYLQTVGELTEPLQKELFEKLGLCVSGDFVLLRHHITTAEGAFLREFSFYSLYMHLSDIPSKIADKTGNSIEYEKKDAPLYLFPGDVLGNPGRAESKEHIYQIEYFTNTPFKADAYLTDGNRYTVVPAGQSLYALTEPEQTKHILPAGTCLEITDFPDAVTRPDSMRIKIKKISGTIDIEKAKEQLRQNAVTTEEKKRSEGLDVADFYSRGKYIIPAGLSGIPVTVFYDNNAIQTEISAAEIEPRGQELLNVYIKKDVVGFGTVWVRTDNTIFKELKGKNMIRVKNNSQFRTWKTSPDEVTATKKTQKTTEEKIVRKDTAIIYYGKRDKTGTVYLPDGDSMSYYKAPTEFLNSYWDWKKYFTFYSESDLKEYKDCTTGTEMRNFFEKLYRSRGFSPEPCRERETLEEFLERTKNIAEKCAFIHASEWNKKRTISEYIFHYVTQYRSLRDQTAIWDNKCRNSKLPKEIQDGNKFTYFYPKIFEAYVKKLYEGYAADLKLVQDMVMKLWILKQGNMGIYPGSYEGDCAPDSVTYCNQAVFLTIKALDAKFNNFTGRSDNAFPEAPKDYSDTYSNRASNHWCHVLKDRATDTKNTGIMELTGEQSQAYANLGYVVIVSWENEAAGGSPHFVTVRPTSMNYTDNKSIRVAHVGGGTNEEVSLEGAFQSHSDDVKFYCNINQVFVYNISEISKYSKQSGI